MIIYVQIILVERILPNQMNHSRLFHHQETKNEPVRWKCSVLFLAEEYNGRD